VLRSRSFGRASSAQEPRIHTRVMLEQAHRIAVRAWWMRMNARRIKELEERMLRVYDRSVGQR
jgi:hypothetical protein